MVKHFRNCGNGPTTFMITVVVRGNILLKRTGRSDSDDGAMIASLLFEL